MKILWLVSWFGNYRVPVFDILNKLDDEQFYLICSKAETSDLVRSKLKKALKDNLIIMDGKGDLKFGNHSSDFANTGLVIKRQKGLYKAIKTVNPDLIIVEGFGGWAPAGLRYALAHHKPALIFYERTAYVERNSPWWRTLYRKIIGKLASGFIINGSLTHQYLNQLGLGHYPMIEGCMVADSSGLSTAVAEMKKCEKQNLRESLHIDSDGIVFLFVGQLVERKGIKQFLAAWTLHSKAYPNDVLLVIGDGILHKELTDKYGKLPSVRILGAVNYAQIFRYYAITDVFVMPTLEDNWSLVVPEAMACGLPVATIPYNGCYVELVKEGENGYVFDAYKQDDMIDMLAKFHKSDLTAMGQKSLEIAAGYTPDIAASKIYELCKNILAKKIKQSMEMIIKIDVCFY